MSIQTVIIEAAKSETSSMDYLIRHYTKAKGEFDRGRKAYAAAYESLKNKPAIFWSKDEMNSLDQFRSEFQGLKINMEALDEKMIFLYEKTVRQCLNAEKKILLYPEKTVARSRIDSVRDKMHKAGECIGQKDILKALTLSLDARHAFINLLEEAKESWLGSHHEHL